VQYSNLAPGKYRFRVIADNSSGLWNEHGDALDFSLSPAYYQTTGFRVLCVAVFLILLWELYQFRLHQIARQFEIRLEERVSERTRIARELHDTLLQSFNGLLLSFQSVLKVLPERPAEARQRLERTLSRANDAVVEARDAVQGLRANGSESNNILEWMVGIKALLRAEGTDLGSDVIHLAIKGVPRDLNPIVRDEVYFITCEALRNAFRHAQAKNIAVEVRYEDRQFRLQVRDDGKGIDRRAIREQSSSVHFGLRGMNERAEIAGGRLKVRSDGVSGTEVFLSIPGSVAYANPQKWSLVSQVLSGKRPVEGSISHE
jgi:signal transduction histidine kinase